MINDEIIKGMSVEELRYWLDMGMAAKNELDKRECLKPYKGIIFPNFEGEETPFNPKGNKTFALVLPEHYDFVDMKNDGWPVKTCDDGHYIYVTINYNCMLYRPVIKLIFPEGRSVELNEHDLDSIKEKPFESIAKVLDLGFYHKKILANVDLFNTEWKGKIISKCYLHEMEVHLNDTYESVMRTIEQLPLMLMGVKP